MKSANESESNLIVSHNSEEWERLHFLLENQEDPTIFWINCDTLKVSNILFQAFKQFFSSRKHYVIELTSDTESLFRIISDVQGTLDEHAFIHVLSLENALKNVNFLRNLNLERENLFLHLSKNTIIWSDDSTASFLHRKAFDFWSWVVFVINFYTPDEVLTSRQKEISDRFVSESDVKIASKDSNTRIRHLEQEFEDFVETIGKPQSAKQLRIAMNISLALVLEYRDEGKYDCIISIISKVLSLNESLLKDSDALILNLQSELGDAYRNIGDFENAERTLSQVVAISTQLNGNSILSASYMSKLATLFLDTEDFTEAELYFKKSLQIYQKYFGENSQYVISSQGNLAVVYQRLGKLDEAKRLSEKAVANTTKFLGGDHPFVAARISNLAVIYMDLGDLKKAIDLTEEALRIDIKNYGENHIYVAKNYNNLGFIYYRLDDFLNAKFYFEKAYVIAKATLGENHPKTKTIINLLKRLEN